MRSWGQRRADPTAGRRDDACGDRGTWSPFSRPGQTRTADLSRMDLLALASGTNSRSQDQGCGLEGLKEARRGIKPGVTEPGPQGRAPGPFASRPGHWGRLLRGRLARGRAGPPGALASPSPPQDA